jgi:hypothetical protein
MWLIGILTFIDRALWLIQDSAGHVLHQHDQEMAAT